MAIFSIVKHNDEAKLVRAGIWGDSYSYPSQYLQGGDWLAFLQMKNVLVRFSHTPTNLLSAQKMSKLKDGKSKFV